MGWVSTRSIQSIILYLSDALDTDACAPVKSSAIFMFWSMSEIGIRSRGRVGQNRKKSILPHPFSANIENLETRQATTITSAGEKA